MKLSVLGYELDEEQKRAALKNDCHTIIIAGAGAGKSTTMVGKIKHLVLNEHIPLEEILCLTFTNNAAQSLEAKIAKELNQNNKVYTFHKLALEILKAYQVDYIIAQDDLLEYTIAEVLGSIENKYFAKLFLTKNYKQTEAFLNYQKIIARFLHLFQANYYNIEAFDPILKKARPKDKAYLKIIKKIYEMYVLEKEAQGMIDFEDMIYKATRLVQARGSHKNIKYIIVDEYQDTSAIREGLVQALRKQSKAYVTVVGDDFQSIYRFSGCDLNNFLHFELNFKPAQKLYITSTYRNSKELITIAGDFIMKNPRQIKKKLQASKSIMKPIVICYYKNKKRDFDKLLKLINPSNLMILGRNNADIYQVLNSKLKLENNKIIYQNANIYYKTIHKAKGLEEENVLIINLANEKNSLPTKIKEEKILRYVVKHYDAYPFEEERRIFYVALTRTKNYCYLFVPKDNPSLFVKELIRNYKKYISFINL